MLQNLSHLFSLLIIFLSLPISPAASFRILSHNLCNPKTLPHPRTLRSDQTTVLINGYSESRLSLLSSIASSYSVSPSVAAVLVLWGNPSTPSQILASLSRNLSLSSNSAPISLLRQHSDSLNARFLPHPQITTRSVLISDDDVSIDPKSVDFALRIWSSNPDCLIGFFARSHDYDLNNRTWIYTVHPDKYSIILTKAMILKTEYLYKYSCENKSKMMKARALVDEMKNCEDILMNFLVAEEAKVGPILVGAKTARDWGDARNEVGEEREAGLSHRRRDHRKRRGECIREFHRILEKMPLKYSYGKVVNSVGEQGLCEKRGKLVFCDEQFV